MRKKNGMILRDVPSIGENKRSRQGNGKKNCAHTHANTFTKEEKNSCRKDEQKGLF